MVERSDDDGVSFGSIGTVGADITSFTDSGLTPGKTYLYRIRSTNVGGESASSNVATATTSGNPPTAPTGVTVEAPAEGGEGRLIVRWVDNSGDETGFRIERKSGSEEFIVVGTVGAGATTFEDTGLSGDTTYTYRVVATNGGGASEASSEAANSTLADPPTNLQATIVNDRNVRLTWTNSGGTGVRIERRLGAGTFSQIGSVGSGVEFFTDSSLSTGATATYRLRTTNRGGSSRVSEEVTVATTPSLASVTLSSASIQGGKTIRGTVSLTAAATQSVTVTITSGDKASATTDRTSVTIARGSRTATFSVRTKRIRTTKNVTISARAGSVTRTATFEVIGSRGGGGGGGGTTPRR